MAVRGAKPKANPLHNGRGRVTEWTDVEDVPYGGPVPVKLPTKSVRVLPFGGTEDVPTHAGTRLWWRVVTRMPHCRLWSASDWLFALETATVADRFFYGSQAAATELARREKTLGLTVDARRDLRIRYVDPASSEGGDEGATVTRLDDYRAL